MEHRYPSAAVGGFVPARLTLARQARSMKQNELARQIEMTPATISKWESSAYDHAPDQQALTTLAHILAVDYSWFFKPIVGRESVAFYRSMRSELNVARDKAAARLRFVDDISTALEEVVEFPEVDIPNLLSCRDYRSLRPDDIDDIANRLRDYWSLGDDPIDDLMVVIENAGVVVAEDFVDSAKLDGVSRWFENTPVMLLAKDKEGGVRRRFDAAHELGHLVLHQHVTDEELSANLPLIEEQAMVFAGSLLLPSSSFAFDVADFTLDSLADLKPRWKVSIGAMIKRLGVLNLITSDHERNLWKYYSYRKWRGNEPYDDRLSVERPANLKAAVEMVVADGPEDVAALMSAIGLLPQDVAQLTGVDVDILMVRRFEKPKLKLVRRNAGVPKAAND